MISLIPVSGLPEIRQDDDLAAMVVQLVELDDHDVVVLAQKAVSKVEGASSGSTPTTRRRRRSISPGTSEIRVRSR